MMPAPCARCGKQAQKMCSACQGAPEGEGGHVDIRYCGANCQKDDWENHKKMCRAFQYRKILYRAAETAQALFYDYRETVFDRKIARVERIGNEMLLYEGRYHEDCFIPFPTSLFPNEDDKKAVLTHMACTDAYGYMDVVLNAMLKGKLRSS